MSVFDFQRSNSDDGRAEGRFAARSYSPTQRLFLLRLSRLLRDRQDHIRQLQPSDWRLRLLNKAIYSTYCDCVGLGVADDARDLFSQSRAGR